MTAASVSLQHPTPPCPLKLGVPQPIFGECFQLSPTPPPWLAQVATVHPQEVRSGKHCNACGGADGACEWHDARTWTLRFCRCAVQGRPQQWRARLRRWGAPAQRCSPWTSLRSPSPQARPQCGPTCADSPAPPGRPNTTSGTAALFVCFSTTACFRVWCGRRTSIISWTCLQMLRRVMEEMWGNTQARGVRGTCALHLPCKQAPESAAQVPVHLQVGPLASGG